MSDIGIVARAVARQIAVVGPGSSQARPFSNLKTGLCDPECPACQGLGYIRLEVPITDPRFGKVQPCPEGDPFKRYAGLLGLDPGEHALTWDSVVDNNDALKAVEAVKATVERGYGWVYLWGGYGLGKTLMLKIAIAEYVRRHRQPAAYVHMIEILDHMRGAYRKDAPSDESAARLDMWADLPLLAIDEFDRFKKTEFAVAQQFQLMDRRYEQACCQRSITIMASNCSPADLGPELGYLTDRIYDGRFAVIQLTGQSARPDMTY